MTSDIPFTGEEITDTSKALNLWQAMWEGGRIPDRKTSS